MELRALLAELRRRRVFRALAWYGGLAWVLIQAASIFQPQLGLPPWTVRAVIVAALVGVPVVGLLSWAFDLERDGGEAQAAASGTPPWRAPSLWLAMAAGLLLTIGAFQAWKVGTAPGPVEPLVTAVLPFENLSGREEDAGLVNGLHASVISELGANPNLAVIGRTSTLTYLGKAVDVVQVAKELGARYLIEGGAQRDGSRLLLNIRLIDGHSGEQAWHGEYQRPVVETFAVQRELASSIANALAIAAAPDSSHSSEALTSDNAERYLRSLSLWGDPYEGFALTAERDEAIALMTTVTREHPQFASGWALLAWMHASRVRVIALQDFDDPRFEHHLPLASAAVARAESLDPQLAEVGIARSLIATASGQFRAAETQAQSAVASRPSDPRALERLHASLKDIGRWDESLSLARRWTVLDPLSAVAWLNLTTTLGAMGRFEQLEAPARRARELDPEATSYLDAWNAICVEGDPRPYDAWGRARFADGLGLPVTARMLGDPERALAAARRLNELRPFGSDDPAQLNWEVLELATSLWEVGDRQSAAQLLAPVLERHLRRSATDYPEFLHPAFFVYRARLLLLSGQPEEAKSAIAEVEATWPRVESGAIKAVHHLLIADLLSAMAEPAAATEHAAQALLHRFASQDWYMCPSAVWLELPGLQSHIPFQDLMARHGARMLRFGTQNPTDKDK